MTTGISPTVNLYFGLATKTNVADRQAENVLETFEVKEKLSRIQDDVKNEVKIVFSILDDSVEDSSVIAIGDLYLKLERKIDELTAKPDSQQLANFYKQQQNNIVRALGLYDPKEVKRILQILKDSPTEYPDKLYKPLIKTLEHPRRQMLKNKTIFYGIGLPVLVLSFIARSTKPYNKIIADRYCYKSR